MVFLFALASGYSQQVTIKTALDTNRIEIGDRLQLSYEVESPEGVEISFPAFTDTLIVDVEIVDSVHIETVSQKKGIVKQLQYIPLTSFELGKHYIPPQAFGIKTGSRIDTVYSKESFFEVVGVAIDTTGAIRDIASVLKAPVVFNDFLPLIVLFALVALIIVLVRVVRKRKREKGILAMPEKPTEPADVTALRELDKLKAQKLWQQEQVKEYYSRLSVIIRAYIEKQFEIRALEETTTEIFNEIKDLGLNDQVNMRVLESLLNLSDLVKFAKSAPEPEENLKQLDNAYLFIKESRELKFVQKKAKETEERLKQLEQSFEYAKKIKNVTQLNDLEVLNRINAGARLVRFNYAISLIAVTFSRSSAPYLVLKDSEIKSYALKYNLLTILFGWWGIPWGPVRSVKALKSNFKGGELVNL